MSGLKALVAAVTLLAMFGLVGCAEDEAVPQAEPGEADVSTAGTAERANDDSEADESVAAYFEAFATQKPSEMKKGQSFAAEGSIAEAYLTHQTALANSDLDGGKQSSPAEVSRVDDGYQICQDDSDRCTVYADITANGAKLASFTVDGRELGNRLLIGDGEKREVGSVATVELISAYKAQANDLFVVFWMKAQTDGVAIEHRTAYLSKNGRQRQLGGWQGPTSLLENSTGTYTVLFPGASLGGTLHLELFAEDGGSLSTASIDISIR